MKLLLIGESILCNYAFGDKNRARSTLKVSEIDIIRVQSMATYISAFDTVKDYDVIVISCILNQISSLENKWADQVMDSDKSQQVVNLIVEMTDHINNAAIEAPNTKVIVLPPTIRTNPKWLSDSFNEFQTFYLASLNDKVVKATPPPISEVDLRADGVHLKDLPLARFRNYVCDVIHPGTSWADEEASPILSRSQQSAPALGAGDSISAARIESMFEKLTDMMSQHGKKIDKTDDQLVKVTENQSMLLSKYYINAARVKEEVDSLHNSQRRHLIIIKKMKKTVALKGANKKEKSNHLLTIVREKISALPQVNMVPNISSVYLLPLPDTDTTYEDFRLVCSTKKDAIEIRNRILNAKQAKIEPWTMTEVSNDPTKSTRVRIFLLQCVARQQRATYQGEIMVNKFSDTPNIVFKQNGRISKVLSFVEAMKQLGNKITDADIIRAKRIAGRAYEGCLKEYFMILNEDDSPGSNPISTETVDDGAVLEATGESQSLGNALKRKLSEHSNNLNKRKR